MKIRLLVCFIFLYINVCSSQTVKILFDATKAEMAGNADWVIDADFHNLGSNFNGAMVPGRGSDSNPQRFPTPLQTDINPSTSETFWAGALSAWAIDIVKYGYEVESLPYNDSITYGNANHPQDLSNYKVFIIDEPNIIFSLSEKIALINFVQNGGGLFMICDHDVSDRNDDVYDSPIIWNDLFANNSIQAYPFGISFDYENFSQTTFNIANLPNDSCLHGVYGDALELQFNNGTSMTLDTFANSSVRGLIYKSGSSNSGRSNVMFASARFGKGKVCALGDSSPVDDGTGDPNDFLYFSYTGEANGAHRQLLMNSTIWLATNNSVIDNADENINDFMFDVYPNPSDGKINFRYTLKKYSDIRIECFDISGRKILEKEIINPGPGLHSETVEINSKGFFIFRLTTTAGVVTRSVYKY